MVAVSEGLGYETNVIISVFSGKKELNRSNIAKRYQEITIISYKPLLLMKMEKKLKIGLEKKKAMLNFMVNFGSKTKSAITNPYFYILTFQKMKSCILTFEHPKTQCAVPSVNI